VGTILAIPDVGFDTESFGAMASNYVAISREAHLHKGWKPLEHMSFALEWAVVPIVGVEVPKAIMTLPVGFLNNGDRFVLHAITGLEPGRNLFITDEGKWIGNYIPAALRGFPFALAEAEDQRILCFDDASGLMVDAEQTEKKFFDADGEISTDLEAVRDFLSHIDQNRVVTNAACQLMDELGIIEPWPITLKMVEHERNIEGLYRINESALNAADDETFLKLRHGGALPIAYMQMLSMTHLPLLGQLSDAHAKREKQMGKIMAESFLTPNSDDIQFNFD
jgi:hypothetical protein